jgi:hypothetical protein
MQGERVIMVFAYEGQSGTGGDLAVMRFEGDITSASRTLVLGHYRSLPGVSKILWISRRCRTESSGIALVFSC